MSSIFKKLILLYFLSLTVILWADDEKIGVSVSSEMTRESDGNIIFMITLDECPLLDLPITYHTEDDSAKNGLDYIGVTNGSVIFEGYTKNQNCETSKVVTVGIIDDSTAEPYEKFFIKIDVGDSRYYVKNSGTGEIYDNDTGYPTIKFQKGVYSEYEGDTGTKNLVFTLDIVGGSLSGSSFDYYTIDGSAKTADNDYVGITKKTMYLNAGETTVTIPVEINGDVDMESNELFYLKIENPQNLMIEGGTTAISEGEIINDDGFSITAPNTHFVEGNGGTTTVNFSIKLDSPAQVNGLSVEYLTVNDSAKGGTGGDGDFDEILPTNVTFNKGEQVKTFSLNINGDMTIESDERFYIVLQNPSNSTIKSGSISITIQNDDSYSQEPFSCDGHMYIASNVNRKTGETGRMWIHQIDFSEKPIKFEPLNEEGSTKIYNAIGYNTEDNYIYGLYHREILRISKTGLVESHGKALGLPQIFEEKQLYAGALYKNKYFVSGIGAPSNVIYVIDINNNNSVTKIYLSKSVNVHDFSFSKDGKHLYGVDDNGLFVDMDLTKFVENGQTSNLYVGKRGIVDRNPQFDSVFTDKLGRFFANDSRGGGFFEFDVTTGKKRLVSNSGGAVLYNDGTNCLNSIPIFNDYGDAPISYSTSYMFTEARHNIVGGIYMGNRVDHDERLYASDDALGDDINGIDDEDGVKLLNGKGLEGAYLSIDSMQELNVTVSATGYLNVWIDYNMDGRFDDTRGECIYKKLKLTKGSHKLQVYVSRYIKPGKSYMRFRFSSVDYLYPCCGVAPDGEIEDYSINFGTQPPAPPSKTGKFNVQRTDSALNAKDFALYTQIVGRDFNYHIVFYDANFTKEETLTKVPVKVDLINYDTKEVLYTRYDYFSDSSPSSRVVVIDNSDLKDVPATKKALFQITYGVNKDGSLASGQYVGNAKQTFLNIVGSADSQKTDDAQDIFSIRPDAFLITISDKNRNMVNSQLVPPNNFVRMASGYEYNLTVRATKYISSTPAKGYNRTINARFDFNSTKGTNTISTPISKTIAIVNGLYSDTNFTNDNVGKYILKIPSDANWTAVDQSTSRDDCVRGSGERVPNTDGLIGCDIITDKYPIEMLFMPHHFDVNLVIKNLPPSTHDDFIYMTDMNQSYGDVAVAVQGTVVAKSKGGQTTTNFTDDCVAQDVSFSIGTKTLSEQGNNTIVKTVKGTTINFLRAVKYNDEVNFLIAKDNLLTNLSKMTIGKEKFLDKNMGTVPIDIRFNIEKNLQEPINPVKMSFDGVKVDSHSAYSDAEGNPNYIPTGKQDINKTVNFYYARVVSDLSNYPPINMNIQNMVRTPLNVDIYCKSAILSYCDDTGVMANTNPFGSTREQAGWYLSTNHNIDIDGNVTELIPIQGNIQINPNPSNEIPLGNGRNGFVVEKFLSCDVSYSVIKIKTDPPLRFEPSEYVINCDKNSSQLTGIGKAGSTMEINQKIDCGGKMDW